jgi:hypothetical protein
MAMANDGVTRNSENGAWKCPTLTVLRSITPLDGPAFVADPRLRCMPSGVQALLAIAEDLRTGLSARKIR